MKDTVEAARLPEDVRAELLARPDAVFADRDVLRALVAANDVALGENVVDMRGAAMRRLEERLGRLENAHQSVVAVAYENLAGTRLVHRAVVALLAADGESDLEALLSGPLAEALCVDRVVLVLEGGRDPGAGGLRRAEPGWTFHYLSPGGRDAARRVTLREAHAGIYGADFRGSEACLSLDLGPARLPGLLCLGMGDVRHFQPGQGTDLLEFLAAVAELVVARLLR
jgi:uncharacterized protein YigA (DUF484 family)